MREFAKYNPANMAPELLLTPPTRIVDEESRYLAKQVAQDICLKGQKLRLGTELEIIFFSPDADPLTYPQYNSKNPNYQSGHQAKMRQLKEWAVARRNRTEGPHTEQSRLCIEFRTRPADITNYFRRVDRLRDDIQAQSRQLAVLPVVHSQHIHISVLDENKSNPLERFGYGVIDDATQQSFSHVLPLVLLPEEIDTDRYRLPVRTNGQTQKVKNPHRLEFRMLSSEWACDPSLNAALSLRGFLECLEQEKDRRKVHPSTSYPGCYASAVAAMAADADLKTFFGEAALEKICGVVQHYPRVSIREILVKDIISGSVPTAPENVAPTVTAMSFMDRIRAIGSFFFGN